MRDGGALYSPLLSEDGGILDDLIIYRYNPAHYRIIVNAATRENDLAWINAEADSYSVDVVERPELAMVAVQGPEARDIAAAIIDSDWRDAALALKPFYALEAGEKFIARTGYTGEDGWEIVMPAEAAADFWQQCIDAGIQPCGLGAWDTLRLEAGMNLYGTDMDATVSPLEAGLGWTIGWEPAERDFTGRGPLSDMRANKGKQKFAGLLLESKGVLRNHQRIVVAGLDDGEITSGGFSPTLGRSIAMARIPAGVYERAQVEVRGRLLDVRVVKLPFVRNGKIRIEV